MPFSRCWGYKGVWPCPQWFSKEQMQQIEENVLNLFWWQISSLLALLRQVLTLTASFHMKHSQSIFLPVLDSSGLCGKSSKSTGPKGNSISTKWAWVLDQISGLGRVANYGLILVLPYGFHVFKKKQNKTVALELFSVTFTAIYKYCSCIMEVTYS